MNWLKRAMELGISYAANKEKLEGLFTRMVDTENNQLRLASWKGKYRSFVRMVKAYFSGQYKEVSPWLFVHTAAGLLYLFTNVDLIPDKLFKLGLLDDVAVLIWVLNTFSHEIEKFELWEADQEIRDIQLA